ncbi:MAG: AAA family ATPase [Spirulina sp.]
MNRSLDYRTDFYSLGVTFYELLTGQLPFPTADAMELVHCQIAKQPVPPCKLVGRHGDEFLPTIVSDIVMKLMAKTAESRYQSAWGLKADLEECIGQWETTGTIEDFPLGSQDISDKFQIPQKLYGREQEIATLLAAFERVAAREQSKIEMMLVAGYSGIGKSALVQEFYKPITEKRGYFISGKFDQFQRNIPYSAIVAAFQGLVRQLLTESSTQLNQWREKLLAALGPNGQVIIDVISEVELIIGKQSAVPSLGPIESQNRFNLVFGNFIRVFCAPEHPLVIFLDDLQWVDSATLKLIELIMTDNDTQYLFLIGAYRDNEVSSTHPLIIILEELQKQEAIINRIALAPLGIDCVSQLIAETLHCDNSSVQALAELVMLKTRGNPFFVNQFLTTLHVEKLLNFDFHRLCWQWDMAQIEAMDITDNVVELMIGKVKKLPPQTQQVLRLAACVGASFDLNTLSIICECSTSEVFQNLLPAVQSGLILPMSELDSQLLIQEYKFSHDRIQQAAYALIEDSRKKTVHLQIGRLLLANTSARERLERLFELVDHLNLGRELITDEREHKKLVRLNLEAGQKAKQATAYAAALQYLNVGMEYLSDNSWTQNYELTSKFYQEKSEVEYLNGNYETSEFLIKLLLAKTRSSLEKADTYSFLVRLYTMLAKYSEAIEAGRQALQLLDIDLPEDDWLNALNVELAEAKKNLGDKKIASLVDEPEMNIPEKKVAVKLLMNLLSPAYLSNQNIFALISTKSSNLSFRYGPIPESAMGYSAYATILLKRSTNYQSAYEFGLLALKITERFNALSNKSKACNVLANHILHWVKPSKFAQPINDEGYKVGLESGDLQFAGYILFNQVCHKFFEGKKLEDILAVVPNNLLFVTKPKNIIAYNAILAHQLAIFNLSSRTQDKFSFYNNAITEAQYLENCQLDKDDFSLCHYYILKSYVLYLYERYELALKYSAEAEKILSIMLCMLGEAEHNCYSSLSLIALYPEATAAEQKEYWTKLETNQKQMKIWADNCPQNFLHKYFLIEAEIARITGKDLEAMELYDRAIASAAENEFIQNEALANELAAKFWLGKGKEKFAQLYLKEAHYGYQLWGAKRKVEDLEEKYPQLLSKAYTKTTRGIQTTSSVTSETSGSHPSDLDVTTVIKASQALAGEIVLDKLLKKLIKIVIENAGAQKGFLILERENNWFIEAEGTADEDDITILQSIPVDSVDSTQSPLLSTAIINYVAHTQENVVLNDAAHEGQFIRDPYIVATQPKSILCTPLLNQGNLNGILYLENNLTAGTFTPDRLEVLKLLSSQASISLQNAQLYVGLRESERKLAQFLEAVPVGIAVLDATGTPYYINQRAKDLLGKGVVISTIREKISEIYKLYLAGTDRVYPPENLPVMRALKGESVTADDIEIHQPNKIIPIEGWGTPIFDDKGEITYAIAAFQDISDRKRAEEERIKFTEQLQVNNIDLQQAREKLADYSRTLEQKVRERTQELSHTLEILKATQAELIFENDLLRSAEQPSAFDYQVGGSLPMGCLTYVVRSADRYLYKALKRGDFCYVLNPRQMGKSSLMVRMIQHLQHDGVCCAPIDMTRIGSENLTRDQWYKGLVYQFVWRFDLRRKVNVKTWWQEREDRSPVQRLSEFIEDVLLVEVGVEDGTSPKQLVIFIDEIDCVLDLNFPVNDFFALIRSCYNQRSLNPEYRRLTFVLFGVTTPSHLMTNIQTTPFNIGQAIQLEGFKEHEAQPLLQGLAEKVSNPQTVLKEVLAWTNGQPFLTQKLCKLVRTASSPIPPNGEAAWIENLVRTNIIEDWEARDEPEHLRTIRDRLLNSPQSPRILELYRQVWHQEAVLASDSPEEKELLLSGLAVKREGNLRVNNRIYESIFDRSWLDNHLQN